MKKKDLVRAFSPHQIFFLSPGPSPSLASSHYRSLPPFIWGVRLYSRDTRSIRHMLSSTPPPRSIQDLSRHGTGKISPLQDHFSIDQHILYSLWILVGG